MLVEYSDYVILAIGAVIAVLGWVLKREHVRVQAIESDMDSMEERLATAVNEIARNDTRDLEWRKAVEANHTRFTTVDEQRREDSRIIFDKIQKLETRLLNKIHEVRN